MLDFPCQEIGLEHVWKRQFFYLMRMLACPEGMAKIVTINLLAFCQVPLLH